MITGAMFFGACASVTAPKDSNLPEVVEAFHHAVRWQYNDTACARVDPRFASAFMDELEDLKDDLHITAWEIRHIDSLPDKKQAQVKIRLSYYKLPSTVIRNETIEQIWQQDKDKDRWYLLSQKNGPFEFPPTEAKTPPTTAPTGEDGSLDAGTEPPQP
jgi:uncharacterized protein YdiU (UPF0061 family)